MKTTVKIILVLLVAGMAGCSLLHSDKYHFWEALKYNDTVKVQEYIEKGMDVSQRDDKGWTPLMLACANRNELLVKLFLEKGADVNVGDDFSPLLLGYPNKEIRELLLDAGADVNVIFFEKERFTLLMSAAIHGDPKIIETFIKAGVKITTVDDEGKTALDYAIKYRNKDAAMLLWNLLKKENATELREKDVVKQIEKLEKADREETERLRRWAEENSGEEFEI